MKSLSYKKSDCCSADCDYHSNDPETPCWGEVDVIDEVYTDEDSWWVYSCEGHLEMRETGKYIKEVIGS